MKEYSSTIKRERERKFESPTGMSNKGLITLRGLEQAKIQLWRANDIIPKGKFAWNSDYSRVLSTIYSFLYEDLLKPYRRQPGQLQPLYICGKWHVEDQIKEGIWVWNSKQMEYEIIQKEVYGSRQRPDRTPVNLLASEQTRAEPRVSAFLRWD